MANTELAELLTPLDLVMPAGYVGALLVFITPDTSPSFLTKFQKGLDSVCERLPWVKGRVVPTRTTKPGLEIRWSAADTTLQIVDKGSIPETYEELARAQIPLESIPGHVWPVPAQPEAEPPAFAASLFRFGGEKATGLCFQGHHNVVDGFGFAAIIKLWAQAINGSERQEQGIYSILGRSSRLASTIDPTAASLSIDDLFKRHPEYSRDPPIMPTESSSCTSEILTISVEKIEALKESLASSLESLPTTNTVACALIWSAITRARIRRTPDLAGKTSRIPMAVNGRTRLDTSLTSLEDPYFGNVVLFSLAEMSASDVSAAGEDGNTKLLADVCRLVADAQSRDHINTAHISEVYHLVDKVEDHRAIFPGWELFGSRDLFITSWTDLDIYEYDFGKDLGKPQFIRTPYAQGDGNVIILPRRREASPQGLEAVVMLQRDDLDALKADSLWKSV